MQSSILAPVARDHGRFVKGFKHAAATIEKFKRRKNAFAGKRHTEATKAIIRLKRRFQPPTFKGHCHTEEAREKISLARRGKGTAERHARWQGGITALNEKIRKSYQYVEWRNAVFTRDNYTCRQCFRRGNVTLHAHHVKPFASYPELRFDVKNGMTLCLPCHRQTDTYGAKLSSQITMYA